MKMYVVSKSKIFLFLLCCCLGTCAATAVADEKMISDDRTVHRDTPFCLRIGKTGHSRWGWVFSTTDPIGCLKHPEEHIREKCGSDYLSEGTCRFSACQELTIPTIYNGWSNRDAEYCGDVSNNDGTTRTLWCYYNLPGKAFCAVFTSRVDEHQQHEPPPESSFQCHDLDPEWGFDFNYRTRENESVYMKAGPCSEQKMLVPDIFEGMTDTQLDEYNQRFNAAFTCPFDTLAPAHANDRRKTKVEWNICQGNICSASFSSIRHDFLLTGQRIDAKTARLENGKIEGQSPFHAQRRGDQVCLTYELKETEINMKNIDDIEETDFNTCASACVAVGDQVDLYWGNTTFNGETNVATNTLRVSEVNTPMSLSD